MPSTNATGIGAPARFNAFSGIVGFLSAMFDTARNWADTELMALPGYRDRVVHVRLAPRTKGGLNLNMARESDHGRQWPSAGSVQASCWPRGSRSNLATDPQTRTSPSFSLGTTTAGSAYRSRHGGARGTGQALPRNMAQI